MLLLILNQILTYSVTPPNSGGQPMRYLLYWLMFLISSIGTNLIVLYLGFTSRQTKNSIKKIKQNIFLLNLYWIIWGHFFQSLLLNLLHHRIYGYCYFRLVIMTSP